MHKHNIRARFNAASDSYSNASRVQQQSAELLINFLKKTALGFKPDTILDLGAGTGHVTELLINEYPDAHVSLNDIADNMLAKAKERFQQHPNFKYHLGDMEQIDFAEHDLIISNLAIQWLDDFKGALMKFSKKSKVLAFSCLLDGTFKEWEEMLQEHMLPSPLMQHPTEDELTNLFKQINYETHNFELKFANAHDFMRYLKNLGASAARANIAPKKLASFMKSCDYEFQVTYKIFLGIVKQ